MKQLKSIVVFFSVSLLPLMLVHCSSMDCSCIGMKADRTAHSKDGKLKLELSVGDSDIKVKISNVSTEPLVVDNGSSAGGFYYGLGLYDKEGKSIMPGPRYDDGFDVTRLDFSKALVELRPGESVCRVYRENGDVHQYGYAHSFEGRVSISKYTFKMPPIKDINRLSFVYYSCPLDAPINVLANFTDQKAPENFYEGFVEVEWKAEPAR